MKKSKIMFALNISANVYAFLVLIYNWVPIVSRLFHPVFLLFEKNNALGFLAMFLIIVFSAFSLVSGIYYFKNSKERKLKAFSAINSFLTIVSIIIFAYLPFIEHQGSLFGEVPPWKDYSFAPWSWILWVMLILLTATNMFLSAFFIKAIPLNRGARSAK